MKRLWRKVKRFFKRDYSEPSEDYRSHGEGERTFYPEWGIIIPHTARSHGASTTFDGVEISEYSYGLDMAQLGGFKYETRDKGGVRGAAERLHARGINASLEPHKNAYNGKARGFEILILKGDSLSEHYARLFIDAFREKYPKRKLRHDDGIKWVGRKTRGYRNLVNAKKAGMEVAMLSEAFFLDNPREWISQKEMADFWSEVLI